MRLHREAGLIADAERRSGAEAPIYSADDTARLKPRPDTRLRAGWVDEKQMQVPVRLRSG